MIRSKILRSILTSVWALNSWLYPQGMWSLNIFFDKMSSLQSCEVALRPANFLIWISPSVSFICSTVCPIRFRFSLSSNFLLSRASRTFSQSPGSTTYEISNQNCYYLQRTTLTKILSVVVESSADCSFEIVKTPNTWWSGSWILHLPLLTNCVGQTSLHYHLNHDVVLNLSRVDGNCFVEKVVDSLNGGSRIFPLSQNLRMYSTYAIIPSLLFCMMTISG